MTQIKLFWLGFKIGWAEQLILISTHTLTIGKIIRDKSYKELKEMGFITQL